MASIRKRNGRWEVQVRRQGAPARSKSFINKADAREWAREQERKIDRQELGPDRRELKTIKLRELVERYRDEILPKKRGGDIETIVLNAFLRHSIVEKTLNELSTKDFASYRDERLKEITPKSLKRQLAPIQNMFKIARVEWHVPVLNHLDDLELSVIDNKRERRLRPGEEDRLLQEAAKKDTTAIGSAFVGPIIEFALETAMRRGEILAVQFKHIDFKRNALFIPVSKSGHSRTIPLTAKAVELLQTAFALPRGIIGPPSPPTLSTKAFPLTPIALRLQWDRLTEKAEIDDLNFHDLRHEAISRFFEMGLTVPEVALISGHRTLGQLMRYSHANQEAVRAKFLNSIRNVPSLIDHQGGQTPLELTS